MARAEQRMLRAGVLRAFMWGIVSPLSKESYVWLERASIVLRY